MDFRRGRAREELEINLIPLIDVLLVILIFLMVTTTYSKTSGLDINLPSADAKPAAEKPNEINVMIAASGDVLVNRVPVGSREIGAIGEALTKAVGDTKEPVLIISSDREAKVQSSVDVMQAAQQAGITAISFATQTASGK